MIKILLLHFLTTVLGSTLFYTTDTYECKNSCIDKNKVFCPQSNQAGGTCCDSSDCDKVDFCSNNAAMESTGLKLWSCPFESSMCGYDLTFVPDENGSSSTIEPTGNYK